MPEIPYGFNRADGLEGRLGTPTPEGAIIAQEAGETITINGITLQELPDSPEIERAEQATITHTFRMSWAEALEKISYIGRGNVAEDSYGNVYLVLSATIRHEPNGTGLLTVVTEAKSFDSPPDEFSVTPIELGVNIMKHPRYFYAFFGDGYGSTTEQQNQMVIRLLQDYFENVSANYRDAIIKLLNGSLSSDAGAGAEGQPPPWNRTTEAFTAGAKVAGTDMAKKAACEIIQKYWRGEETPYIVGHEIRLSQYFFISPALNPGGYVENPITEANPQLPEYFYSTEFPPDPAHTIFDLMPQVNPQCYSDTGLSTGDVNISWLRKADEVEFARTWFRLTRTWIGSPIGFWDVDLYNRGPRPLSAGDYKTINPGG